MFRHQNWISKFSNLWFLCFRCRIVDSCFVEQITRTFKRNYGVQKPWLFEESNLLGAKAAKSLKELIWQGFLNRLYLLDDFCKDSRLLESTCRVDPAKLFGINVAIRHGCFCQIWVIRNTVNCSTMSCKKISKQLANLLNITTKIATKHHRPWFGIIHRASWLCSEI